MQSVAALCSSQTWSDCRPKPYRFLCKLWTNIFLTLGFSIPNWNQHAWQKYLPADLHRFASVSCDWSLNPKFKDLKAQLFSWDWNYLTIRLLARCDASTCEPNSEQWIGTFASRCQVVYDPDRKHPVFSILHVCMIRIDMTATEVLWLQKIIKWHESARQHEIISVKCYQTICNNVRYD